MNKQKKVAQEESKMYPETKLKDMEDWFTWHRIQYCSYRKAQQHTRKLRKTANDLKEYNKWTTGMLQKQTNKQKTPPKFWSSRTQ